MFDLPQPVLEKLLIAFKTAPERLSASEAEISKRICRCTCCGAYWVRRKSRTPDRCPKCHRRDWDRPLIAAMMGTTVPTPAHTHESSEKKENGGAR